MILRAKKYFKQICGIAPSILAGVLIPLSFFDYFGQTGWVFAACLGSRRGGVLALIMFILGALLTNNINVKSAVNGELNTAVTVLIPVLLCSHFDLTISVLILSLIFLCLMSEKMKISRKLIIAIAASAAAIAGLFIPFSSKPEVACINALLDGGLFCAGIRMLTKNENVGIIISGTVVLIACVIF